MKDHTYGVSTIPSAVLVALEPADIETCKRLLAPFPCHPCADAESASACVLKYQAHIVLIGAALDAPGRAQVKEAATACGAEVLEVPADGDPWVLELIFQDALRKVEQRRMPR